MDGWITQLVGLVFCCLHSYFGVHGGKECIKPERLIAY